MDIHFSGQERFIIIGEIGRMPGLSFGEALELLDRLLGGAIISPGARPEPVDPVQLGRLICQVGARQDIPHQERRALICKLAMAGQGTTVPKGRHGLPARLSQVLLAWIGHSSPADAAPRKEHIHPDNGELDEIERFVRHISDYFTPSEEIGNFPFSCTLHDEYPMNDPDWNERLNRALPGDDDLFGVTYGPRQKKKNPIRDEDESDILDSRSSNWFWGE